MVLALEKTYHLLIAYTCKSFVFRWETFAILMECKRFESERKATVIYIFLLFIFSHHPVSIGDS